MLQTFNFIVVKDPHLMYGFRNNIRKHGWEKDIDSKLLQIISYAKTNNIKTVIFTGDVFEKSRKKDWSLNQLQENKKRLKWFKKEDIVVISNLGNHDYFAGLESLQGTAFGEMVDLDLIQYQGSNMAPRTEGDIEIFGIDYHQSNDTTIDELERITARKKEGPRVVIMHSNITDSQIRLTDFTYEQLSRYDIDVICCGHWHLSPEKGAVQCVGGTWFLNPWNLTRVSRDYAVKLDEHHPEFIHASITKVGEEYNYEFKEVKLEVRPFSEAFNIDIINMLQELGKTGFDFFKTVDLDNQEEIDDEERILLNLAKSNNISERAVKIACELLE